MEYATEVVLWFELRKFAILCELELWKIGLVWKFNGFWGTVFDLGLGFFFDVIVVGGLSCCVCFG